MVSRNGIYFWPILYMSMMVMGNNHHLVIVDPFLAFHQCLTVSRNGIYFWPILYMSMMVKGTNCHLVIDPFLAFHQCLMLILLSALLVVVYWNKNLLEDPRMWQGSPGMVYTFGPYYIHLWWSISYGQGKTLLLPQSLILVLVPWSKAQISSDTSSIVAARHYISCCVLK
jgi:hypothetical protein